MGKNKQISLIIDQQEITKNDLLKMRDEAIVEWRKTEKSIVRLKSKQKDAESIIESCNARLRLIRLMSNE